MERKKLGAAEITEELKALNGWRAENDRLSKRFGFPDFAAALAFVNRVGEIAEKHDHHPDVAFGWGYAEIELTTHDRGGLTAFDFAVARAVDAL
jgi:4a-hydroxytetrahydrobiopterin dehydratase